MASICSRALRQTRHGHVSISSRHIWSNESFQSPNNITSFQNTLFFKRGLLTLAIETSCDDTSVAIIERHDEISKHTRPKATLHFHEKITSNNTAFGGIHPLVALQSHQENLSLLVDRAIHHLPDVPKSYDSPTISLSRDSGQVEKQRPDFVSVTRGPGMRTSLQTGLDTAKGLAVAWQIPLVGVHHMQAHALTPRFVSAIDTSTEALQPEFPFLSALVSGGHTLIIHSSSLTEHQILATTADTAIGDFLDKAARAILPPEVLEGCKSTMYGAVLEQYTFPTADLEDQLIDYNYQPPLTLAEELTKKTSRYNWGLPPPFAQSSGSTKAKSLEFSFGGLTTAVERVAKFGVDANGKFLKTNREPGQFTDEERKELAREAMRVGFEHLISRIFLALEHLQKTDPTTADGIKSLVMSGGVAANRYLRHILSTTLHARGYHNITPIFPPPKWCTDNAAMIAWAGIEMYDTGYTTPLSARAIRKWPLDKLMEPPIDE